MKLVIALLFMSNLVHAEPRPHALGVTAGARFMQGSTYPELAISGSRRWWDRLHLGGRVTVGRGLIATVTREMVELGVVLHPSQRLDVLLAWRVGHAYHRVMFPSGTMIPVHAAVLEPVLELAFRIGAATELRVVPFSIAAHNTGMWLYVFGAELAVARRF